MDLLSIKHIKFSFLKNIHQTLLLLLKIDLKKMLEKLKRRWNIENNFQLVIILIVFAVTGTSTMYARKGAFYILGITTETSMWIKVPLYIILIIPIYQILFLIVGTLFGQFKFAWEFEKKIFSRFRFKKK